jgi:phosphoribosylanthranilate isomerase
MVRFKVCCIQNIDDVKLAVKHGASAVGLVSKMPSGPGVISDEQIAEIADEVPPGIGTFLLTSLQNADAIIEQQRYCRTNSIQICDRLTEGTHAGLKKALPGISIIQVVHVIGESSVKEALEIAPLVHALLLDSGNQNLKIKELGGTGRTHNWELSRKIVQGAGVPVFLAGGLNPGNILDAVQSVRPYAVDICSGIRNQCMELDEEKLIEFSNLLRQL